MIMTKILLIQDYSWKILSLKTITDWSLVTSILIPYRKTDNTGQVKAKHIQLFH